MVNGPVKESIFLANRANLLAMFMKAILSTVNMKEVVSIHLVKKGKITLVMFMRVNLLKANEMV